jgi:hypothetical protein
MHVADRIHLVGSGSYGFSLSDPYDCHIYLIDGGSELALIDVVGIDALFPGHFAFSLRDGQRHIERANEVLDQLLIPPQAVSAW